jgi:hypothetical protein
MRFFWQALAGAVGVFLAAVALKFSCEHWAAPTTSGLHGALRGAGSEVLFIGSSHTRQSYDVAALEREMDCSAYLIAYNGLDYVSMAPIVRECLADPGRRPRVLVLEAYALSLVPAGGVPDTRLFFDAPPRLKWKLMPRYAMEGDRLERFANLFDLLVNRNNDLLLMFPVLSLGINRLSYRGGYVGKTVAGLGSFGDMAITLPADGPDHRELEALTAIVASAREYGVPLISIESPLPKPIEAQPSVRNLKNALGQFLAAQNVRYVDGAAGFPTGEPRYFADSNHLSTEGRTVFTHIVAGIVRDALMGSSQAGSPLKSRVGSANEPVVTARASSRGGLPASPQERNAQRDRAR